MNELIALTRHNDQAVVNSREIAEHFGKNHKDVLRSIENLAAENCAAKSMFYETTFENRGKQYPMYLMNRDGFSLLAMGFTGKAALEWKLKYIEAFNGMDKVIRQIPAASSTEDWRLIRSQAMELNAKTKAFKAIMAAVADKGLTQVAAQVYGIKALENLTGEEIAALPQTGKLYTATEIGNALHISAQKVGSLAIANNLKTEEFGVWLADKSPYSGKQVSTFRYNQKGKDRLKALLQD